MQKNMPIPLLELAKSRLVAIFDKNPVIVNQLISLIDDAIKAPANQEEWNNFQKEISLRESIRKNSILTTMPEFAPFWNYTKSI